MNLKRTLALAAMTLVTGTACSTTYQPKHDGRIHLVVDHGQLALQKDASTVRQDGPFSALASCDDQSKSFANHAEARIKTGMDLTMFSALSYILVGPGIPLGVVLAIIAQGELDHGTASMVDAINRHNDAAACTLAKN